MEQPPLPIREQAAGLAAGRSSSSSATPSTEPAAASTTDTFRIDDDDRYGRLRLISWWRQERLAAAKILVVGAGALGNEVLKNLALVGVGTTYLIDLDRVEPSNLSRSVLFRAEDAGKPKAVAAAARARDLNPEIAIVPMHGDVITDLGLGLFADVDLVIGCLDNREARLWVNRQCWKVGTPWIDAGIQEIQGVVKIFVPPDSACYECAMTQRDYQLLNLRYSCPLLKRDEILAGKVPTAPTIASMMAALQVQEALKLLHGLPVAAGSALVYNGVGNQFYSTRLPFREDCLSHETYPAPGELMLGRDSTVAELFAAAQKELEPPLSLGLDRELVVAVDCPRCGWRQEIMKPRTKVRQGDAVCPNCREPGRPEILSAIDHGSPLLDRTLAAVGVPAYDIVRVDGGSGSRFFLLGGDRTGRDAGWGLDR
jgi:molybdopterin/thiamine biosynthesis adenylyltransferase